ncbi:putative integral membrane protein [Brugia pahangi]
MVGCFLQHSAFLGLAVLVLLSLASVPWLLINGLLWLIALAALSGSILAQLTYHIPSLRVVQTEYLLCILLATSFLLSLIIQYDFDSFDRSSTNKASKLTVRSNEHRPLLQTYVGGYGYYQAF